MTKLKLKPSFVLRFHLQLRTAPLLHKKSIINTKSVWRRKMSFLILDVLTNKGSIIIWNWQYLNKSKCWIINRDSLCTFCNKENICENIFHNLFPSRLSMSALFLVLLSPNRQSGSFGPQMYSWSYMFLVM